MTARRGRFEGVAEILRFNWHFYAASTAALFTVGALLWLVRMPQWVAAGLLLAAVVAAWWSLGSLAASYYIYDVAQVTGWKWLPGALLEAPERWLNLHAGLDQSTEILRSLFPDSDGVVVDFYDPMEMTEPSIARARRLHPSVAVEGRLDALPLPDGDRDTVFLLFAAHEVRDPARRLEFFLEVARVLSAGGQVVVAEHLRDGMNFAAFGPGFLHFFPRSEWLRLAREAGFTIRREQSLTPFVRCFVLSKAAA